MMVMDVTMMVMWTTVIILVYDDNGYDDGDVDDNDDAGL